MNRRRDFSESPRWRELSAEQIAKAEPRPAAAPHVPITLAKLVSDLLLSRAETLAETQGLPLDQAISVVTKTDEGRSLVWCTTLPEARQPAGDALSEIAKRRHDPASLDRLEHLTKAINK